MEEKAARAYDLAALKYWGPSTHINFPLLWCATLKEGYERSLTCLCICCLCRVKLNLKKGMV